MALLRVNGGQIDNANVTSCLSKLLPLCLQYAWDLVPTEEELEQGRLYSEKPADAREEMFVRAKEALHSEALATFAVKELLPLLETEQRDEALELVLGAFEGSRFDALP